MKVLFATSNAHKVKFTQRALKPYGVKVSQAVVNLSESRAEEPENIVLEKAEQAFNKTCFEGLT